LRGFFLTDGTCPLNVRFTTLNLGAQRGADVRRHHADQQQENRAYYRLLRHFLTEEVQRNFKEEQQELPEPMSDLMRKLEDAFRKSPTAQKRSQ